MLKRTAQLPTSPDRAWAWHLRPGVADRLTAPWERVRVDEFPVPATEGAQASYRVRIAGLWRPWVVQYSDLLPGVSFKERLVQGPTFTRFEHLHSFEPTDSGCQLSDCMEWDLPWYAKGANGLTTRKLDLNLSYRHARTAADLRRHADHAPITVAISGASGFLGRALWAFLSTGGHRVLRLVRREAVAPDEVTWDPAAGTIDIAALEGVDAIVHLAGETVAQRWSDAARDRILKSREQGTRLIAEAAASLGSQPTLISASAVGWYGDRSDAVDESVGAGEGFLADVCKAWEGATEPAVRGRSRVVNARMGLVLGQSGGALAKMLGPFKAGAGGVPGDGTAPVPWISLDDAVYALHHCLMTTTVAGPVNITTAVATQRELATTLGAAIGRPVFMPLPEPLIRTLFGDMGTETLLRGARVTPGVLQSSGFTPENPVLERFLMEELAH